MPEVLALARALLESEGPGSSVEARAEAARRVLERLAARISPLVGAGGFHLLLQRALKRAREAHPWLEALQAGADEPWPAGAGEAPPDVAAEDASAGFEAAVAELIGLLARFLGADMAVRLVRQSFPEVPWGGDTGSGSEERIHE